jgi:hypothetical protein
VHGATSGTLLKLQFSETYVTELMRSEVDVPFVACKAETTIRSPERYLSTAQVERHTYEGGGATDLDPRLYTPQEMITTVAAEYRVVGLGRGTDTEDCGRAALSACNQVVTRYWQARDTVRPIDVPCQLSRDGERCCSADGT